MNEYRNLRKKEKNARNIWSIPLRSDYSKPFSTDNWFILRFASDQRM